MKLSRRLLTIASMVRKHSHVIDVGADHGLLEKYLLDNEIVDSILAVENKEGPFNILRNSLKDYDAKVSLSDGLDEMTSDIDTIIIAGMGGNSIVDILRKDVSKLNGIQQIIVDAHRDADLVRRTIIEFGFRIEKESIVFENNKYYFIISFTKGDAIYKEVEIEFGYKVRNDPLFQEFKAQEIERLKKNLSLKTKKDDVNKIKKRLERLESL